MTAAQTTPVLPIVIADGVIKQFGRLPLSAA
jgi:hypothetical protein